MTAHKVLTPNILGTQIVLINLKVCAMPRMEKVAHVTPTDQLLPTPTYNLSLTYYLSRHITGS